MNNMVCWSPADIIHSETCLVFILTGIICSAVRCFHMCRPFDQQSRYFYPARGQVSFFMAAVAMEFPYVIAPADPAAWNYVRIFGIVFYPMCLSSIYLRYFRWQRLDRVSNRLSVVVPMTALSILMVMALTGNSFLAEGGLPLMISAAVVSLLLSIRIVKVTIWVRKRINDYHRQNYSSEDDFPYKFAANVLYLPLVWILLQWAVFLSDSKELNVAVDLLMSVCLVVALCAILHPQRALQPGKVQEDMDRIEEDEKEIIGEAMAAEAQDNSAENSPLTWDEESKRQVLDIIRRRYKEQHLQKSDVLSEMDKGKAAPASRFIASVGYYNLINMFRLEHARQYIEAHPEAKLAVVAEESGFASGSSFSKAKRSVPEIIPEYVDGVHI